MTAPSASLFSLPLAQWQQPQSIRVTKYKRKKRQRGKDEDEDEDDDWGTEDDNDGTDADVGSGSHVAKDPLVLSPEEAHQYRIAGLPFDQELPGGHFPHAAPGAETGGRRYRKDYIKNLSDLSPPLFVPQSASQQGNLRLRHLAVVTTILHRCLLEGDYVRAGRAWGLILREEMSGRPIDVRLNGRWGIGAEILLRQNSGSASRSESTAVIGSVPVFSRQGFEAAKVYYERLILQYPYRKASPDAVSSLHFYPAMFGLWVYVVQGESSVAREALHIKDDSVPESNSEEDDSMSISETMGEQSRTTSSRVVEIRLKELDEAQQIAGRMDELLTSPPYSDSPALLRLRGMVALWIGDLFVSSISGEDDDTDALSDQDSMIAAESPEAMMARREKRLAMDKREIEVNRSRELFERASMRGKGVAHSLEDLHIDDLD
jgi:hypothetical protein